MKPHYRLTDYRLTDEQIAAILDRIVPLIADPADHAFFRAMIGMTAERMTAPAFAYFVHSLLRTAGDAH